MSTESDPRVPEGAPWTIIDDADDMFELQSTTTGIPYKMTKRDYEALVEAWNTIQKRLTANQ